MIVPETSQELLDALWPGHDRTSCSDLDSNGNEYANEFGYARCVRCAVLSFLRDGVTPYEGNRLTIDCGARYVGPPPKHYADSDRWVRT